MRCLLVEDEALRIEEIKPELEKHFGAGNVEVAEDRDAAIVQISARAFDLIVLDQRIPTAAGQLDPDVEHGRAVLAHIQGTVPDTPVYFFTALPMEDDYIDEIINNGRRCDVWGDRQPIVLVRRFSKATPAPFYDAVKQIADTARITAAIEINTKGAGLALDDAEMRLLKCFARRQNGECVDVEMLSDGLSGANVLKTNIKDLNGGLRISAATKLGRPSLIARELGCYDPEIVRLPATTYAPIVSTDMPRIGGKQGAFYRLADGFNRPLFEVLFSSDMDAAACVRALQAAERPWFDNHTTRLMPISEMAKLIVHEDRLAGVHAELAGVDWQKFEDREVRSYACTRHGDLHGENARVDAGNRVVLIDYGSVRTLPSAIDAITLELSPVFHPHGRRDLLKWVPGDGPIDWFDRQAFCRLLAIPEYVNAARDWAHAEAYGDREVIACAYAYVLRQISLSLIKPEWSDKDLAVAIAKGIIARGMP